MNNFSQKNEFIDSEKLKRIIVTLFKGKKLMKGGREGGREGGKGVVLSLCGGSAQAQLSAFHTHLFLLTGGSFWCSGHLTETAVNYFSLLCSILPSSL